MRNFARSFNFFRLLCDFFFPFSSFRRSGDAQVAILFFGVSHKRFWLVRALFSIIGGFRPRFFLKQVFSFLCG